MNQFIVFYILSPAPLAFTFFSLGCVASPAQIERVRRTVDTFHWRRSSRLLLRLFSSMRRHVSASTCGQPMGSILIAFSEFNHRMSRKSPHCVFVCKLHWNSNECDPHTRTFDWQSVTFEWAGEGAALSNPLLGDSVINSAQTTSSSIGLNINLDVIAFHSATPEPKTSNATRDRHFSSSCAGQKREREWDMEFSGVLGGLKIAHVLARKLWTANKISDFYDRIRRQRGELWPFESVAAPLANEVKSFGALKIAENKEADDRATDSSNEIDGDIVGGDDAPSALSILRSHQRANDLMNYWRWSANKSHSEQRLRIAQKFCLSDSIASNNVAVERVCITFHVIYENFGWKQLIKLIGSAEFSENVRSAAALLLIFFFRQSNHIAGVRQIWFFHSSDFLVRVAATSVFIATCE